MIAHRLSHREDGGIIPHLARSGKDCHSVVGEYNLWLGGVKVNLDIELRARLADGILGCLQEAACGSQASLRGSLAAGKADQYSDIDVLWEIPDPAFKPAVDGLKETLSQMYPVESLRSSPEFQNSEKRRLVFLRFVGIPLFWRLDLEIFAQSINRDQEYDLQNPDARGSDWSLTESALMNGVAAIKAHLRDKDAEARRLLERAYQRVGSDFPALELRELILRLVAEIETMDPKTAALSKNVRALVTETLG
jgi:predicted nucleotidyltransferase